MVIKNILIYVFIIIFLGYLTYRLKPYEQSKLNLIDIMSTIICCCTLIMGILIYGNSLDGWVYIGYFVMALVNLYFILYMLYSIVKTLSKDL